MEKLRFLTTEERVQKLHMLLQRVVLSLVGDTVTLLRLLDDTLIKPELTFSIVCDLHADKEL